MPMGGKGERFTKDGIATPKPLIDLKGKPFFYWAANSILKYAEVKTLVFVVLREHAEKFGIDAVIRSYYPGARFVYLDAVLNGAVLTCREGVKAVDNEYPVVFNDCDHLFYAPGLYDYYNGNDFDGLAGVLLSFQSNNPRSSYMLYDKDGYVIKTVEKQAVSGEAICGAYLFKNKEVFLQASDDYLKKCSYQEYFMSGVYNSLIACNGKIKSFPVESLLTFGTPEEYEQAEKTEIAAFLGPK
jgi:NDP-sugar pyrophosphorylase family protein